VLPLFKVLLTTSQELRLFSKTIACARLLCKQKGCYFNLLFGSKLVG